MVYLSIGLASLYVIIILSALTLLYIPLVIICCVKPDAYVTNTSAVYGISILPENTNKFAVIFEYAGTLA